MNWRFTAPPTEVNPRRWLTCTVERVLLAPPVINVGRQLTSVLDGTAQRRSRAWVAMVAVPLEMNATMLLQLWWTFPALVVCAWWWAERDWPYKWLIAVQLGTLGSCWCYAGAYSLASWPTWTLLIGAIWATFALALAVLSLLTRCNELYVWGTSSGR